MKLEKVIGAQIAAARDGKMTQAELGERVGRYLGKQWSRQTVSAAEKGGRSFTALELLVLSVELEVPLYSLFGSADVGDDKMIETPGGVPISPERLLPELQEVAGQQEQLAAALALLNEAAMIIATNAPAYGFIGRLLTSGLLPLEQGVLISNLYKATATQRDAAYGDLAASFKEKEGE